MKKKKDALKKDTLKKDALAIVPKGLAPTDPKVLTLPKDEYRRSLLKIKDAEFIPMMDATASTLEADTNGFVIDRDALASKKEFLDRKYILLGDARRRFRENPKTFYGGIGWIAFCEKHNLPLQQTQRALKGKYGPDVKKITKKNKEHPAAPPTPKYTTGQYEKNKALLKLQLKKGKIEPYYAETTKVCIAMTNAAVKELGIIETKEGNKTFWEMPVAKEPAKPEPPKPVDGEYLPNPTTQEPGTSGVSTRTELHKGSVIKLWGTEYPLAAEPDYGKWMRLKKDVEGRITGGVLEIPVEVKEREAS